MYRLQLVVGFCLLSLFAAAQRIENIRATQEGTRLIVLYDLVSDHTDATFTVALYASHNNFANPVSRVTGAAGKGQKAGKDKRIEWDLYELQRFSGQVTVELGALPEAVKLAFKTPTTSGKAKQGKTIQIAWAGGTLEPSVRIEVYRNGALATAIGEKKNTGSCDWAVPADLSKGSGYTIRMSAGNERIESQPFSVKGKMPILLVAGSAAVVIGSTVAWIILRPLEEAPPPPN